VPSTVQSEDEDAAERVRAPDENLSLIHAEGVATATPLPAGVPTAAPQPKPVPPALPKPATQPAPLKPLPAVPPPVARSVPSQQVATAQRIPAQTVEARRPEPRPNMVASARPDTELASAQSQLVKAAVTTPAVNAPRPQIRPSLHEDVAEGDSEPVPTPGHNWTIQIGAYADKTLAAAQLKTYYGKAQDVLARANQIIAPITSAKGHTIYRARFGLFAEQEAREVCNRLTQRGQTCFAALQVR
jgi:hypothetical protein